MKRLFPGVYSWSVFHKEFKINLTSWLVEDEKQVVLIDPVAMKPAEITRVRKRGKPVVILLTNHNHRRWTANCRRKFRAPVYAHRRATPRLRVRVDKTFGHGDRLPGGLRVIHIPGATPGETALLLKVSRGVLIVGDALVGQPAGQLHLLPHEYSENPKQAKASARTLLRYPFDAVLPSHGAPVLNGAKALLRRALVK